MDAHVMNLDADTVAAAATKNPVARKTYHLHEVQPLGHPQRLASVGGPTICKGGV